MRIISGRFRGTKLAEVGEGDLAARLRPTGDRVRESVFNILQNGGYGDVVADAHVLDLFAGTGALGLEALSRGASDATFVENGTPARAILKKNIAKLGVGEVTRIVQVDATALSGPTAAPFDLVFLDPPYGKGLGEAALAAVHSAGWLAPDVVIVWEEGAQHRPPDGFAVLDARRYGDTFIHILEITGANEQ